MKPIDRFTHIKLGNVERRQLSILLTSLVVGFLIVIQARSFTDANSLLGRDTRSDIFREIKVLKVTNEKLADEIKSLEDQLNKASDNEKAMEAVQTETEKYRMLTGRVDVKGPGIELAVNGEIKAIWLTDIVNELFDAGAEAVSVNGIRLTDTTSGFDTIPNGQILLNGSIIKAPFNVRAIGDKIVLQEALEQPHGILQRMKQSIRAVDFKLNAADLIVMEKVL
jgi:uncharacterized protein YlxW (UPF0749 family)